MLSEQRAAEIRRKARQLVTRYSTADPIRLADRHLGIIVDYNEHPHLLGFSGRMLDQPYIGLNSNADEDTLRSVCAHELGHILLGHADSERLRVVRGTELADMESELEAEANCFAASLLLDDDETLEAIDRFQQIPQVAAQLCVRPELLIAELKLLRMRGYAVTVPDRSEIARWEI